MGREVLDLGAELVAVAAEAAQELSVHGVPRAEPIAVRLHVDDRAGVIEVADAIGHGADLVEHAIAALDQVPVTGRKEPDTGAALFELGRRPLVDRDVVPEVSQHEPRSEASEGASCDRDAKPSAHRWPG